MYTSQNADKWNQQTQCNIPPNPLLTMKDVCRLLNVGNATIRRWNSRGIIKAYRIGIRRDRRFNQQDIGALLYKVTKDLQTPQLKVSTQ